MRVKALLRPVSSSTTVQQLEQRITDLEADLTELRRHNLRLAEMADVIQELLVPMASRDEEAVRDAIARFRESL
jgi:hypothetical protein